ncbi:MAG: hypothetical protein A4E69_00989 [Syntrophus sp. PtaB.Bin138]|nr:MAG: hypothetical protein A4E69_00989 [Syntrophus sp. PtaB.Bin138]
MLPDNLAFIDYLSGRDEKPPPGLQGIEGVSCGRAILHGDEHAVLPMGDGALEGLILVKLMMDDGLACGGVEKAVPQSDHSARRDMELQTGPTPDGIDFLEFSPLFADHFNDSAGEIGRYVHNEKLDGFCLPVVDFLVDDMRLAHLELIAFPAHCFNQDGKVQYAPSIDLEGFRSRGSLHAQGNVALDLSVQPVPQMAARDIPPFLPEKGRIVVGKRHAHRRFIHGDDGQRLRIIDVRDRIPDIDVFRTEDGADVSAGDFSGFITLQPLEEEHVLYDGFLSEAVTLYDGYGHPGADCSAENTSDGDPAHIVRIVNRGDLHL